MDPDSNTAKLFCSKGSMDGGGGWRKREHVRLLYVPRHVNNRYINSYFDWNASLMRAVSILEGEGVDHHFLLVRTYENEKIMCRINFQGKLFYTSFRGTTFECGFKKKKQHKKHLNIRIHE